MNLRLALSGALVLCACRPQTTPTHHRGNTDVGTPQTLAADGRYVPAADRRPGVFPESWRHKAGRVPVLGAHAMVASDVPLGSAAGVES